MTPSHPAQPASPRALSQYLWFWAAVLLTAVKLWFTAGQTVYAIGPAIHDDKLFILLTEHIIHGQWLGPYNQFTLAKGPLYSLFVAVNFWLGLPLLFTQQLLYAGACAVVVRSLTPWLRAAGLRFALYAVLLLNPMSYDASNLSRLMRQSIYTPLGLLVIASLITLFARRRESARRIFIPATLAGLAYGSFWITREESVWLLPVIGLLWLAPLVSLRREWRVRWRGLVLAAAGFIAAFLLPILTLSTINYRYYGWFGTVEFRATEFKDAYGALTRIAVGPDLPQVPVTRQMREAAYRVSPTFAQLQPWLEGPVGDHWADRQTYTAAERQIYGGWFMWALRDAMTAAGLTPDAATALRNYQKIATEVNAACADGRLPARPPRSGFFPRITRAEWSPLWHETLDYLVYFGTFRGFAADSPASTGDYAELKPFRDYVGTHLSPAPRSPDPLPPDQERLQRWQINTLEASGQFSTGLIAWVGPFLLLVGLARGIEAVVRRRITYLLGLAGALLASVAAYLAINIIITVTSFENVSPAAMAAAYPLYLLALAALATDALTAWGLAAAPIRAINSQAPLPSRWRWLLPIGTTLIVCGARLREIHLFGGDVPFNDQWIIEAEQLIAPWLDGTLRPWTFFLPHFEHLPVWTRLLAWLEVALTGRWDPLMQMTVNTALYGGFVWLVARWLWRNFTPATAGLITILLILGGALPHAWENIAWGFQSQFPLALLGLWLHVQGSFTHPAGSRRWWLAQAAGAAGLLTLASMWLAPLAVVAALVWTRRTARREWLVPAIIAAVGAGLLAIIHWSGGAEPSFAQATRSLMDFAHAGLHLLGWPSGVPGAAAIMVLPWLVHAMRLRGRAEAAPEDRVVFTLGLWAMLQAAALAFARTGDTNDFVSRYGDLLLVGLLANGIALARLAPASGRRRLLWVGLVLLWSGLAVGGLWQRSSEGHARYFHEHAADNNQLRRAAIQAYLEHRDRTLLDQRETRWVLSQSTDGVTRLLDRADFRALLPATVDPTNPPTLAGRGVRRLQAVWPWVLAAGLVAAGAGLVVVLRRGGAPPLPALNVRADPWPARVSVAIALGSFVALLGWSGPLFSARDARWRQILGGDQALTGLTFDFAAPTGFPRERLQGAAPVSPVELRNRLYGTAPAGPALTGVVFSSAFTLARDWLVVPYAGYPTGSGNGLRLQLLKADGHSVEREIGCPGPNRDGLGFWTIDVKALRGRRARLVLYDGRTDLEAWVAAAAPIATDDPDLATTLSARADREHYYNLHATLLIVFVVASVCAALTFRRRDN